MKIQITARFTGLVLFEHEAENNTMKLTLEAAISAGANLAGANLAGANLAGANLDGANLADKSELQGEHDNNDHAKEYRAALAMIDAHAEIWTPKLEEKEAA